MSMNRWLRLIAAVTAMIMIANLQYAWTLFVQPMMAATGWYYLSPRKRLRAAAPSAGELGSCRPNS